MIYRHIKETDAELSNKSKMTEQSKFSSNESVTSPHHIFTGSTCWALRSLKQVSLQHDNFLFIIAVIVKSLGRYKPTNHTSKFTVALYSKSYRFFSQRSVWFSQGGRNFKASCP